MCPPHLHLPPPFRVSCRLGPLSALARQGGHRCPRSAPPGLYPNPRWTLGPEGFITAWTLQFHSWCLMSSGHRCENKGKMTLFVSLQGCGHSSVTSQCSHSHLECPGLPSVRLLPFQSLGRKGSSEESEPCPRPQERSDGRRAWCVPSAPLCPTPEVSGALHLVPQ